CGGLGAARRRMAGIISTCPWNRARIRGRRFTSLPLRRVGRCANSRAGRRASNRFSWTSFTPITDENAPGADPARTEVALLLAGGVCGALPCARAERLELLFNRGGFLRRSNADHRSRGIF